MSRCHIPYLLRRGNSFSFRIAVPADLRPVVGAREIVKTLRTPDHALAVPAALELAAAAKRLFIQLRRKMTNNNQNADQSGEELTVGFEFEMDRNEFGFPRLRVKGEPHEQDAMNAVIATALQHVQNLGVPQPSPVKENASEARHGASVPMLKDVVDSFLARYGKTGSPQMFKKHSMVLPLLLEVVGNRSIDSIRQAHINEFFDIVCGLPPRWKDIARKQGLTVRQIAGQEHEVTLGPKSFEDTYIASIRPFLKSAKKDWQDQGFPLGLTTEGIDYQGDRAEDESKQRSFTTEELRKLFEGDAMRGIAADRTQAHCYWLPHIGLFTGARVNEICQLNPQVDILPDDTGVWYFWINEETPADVGIVKSVKTGDARKVPIHKTLIDLGLLGYVDRIKAAGGKRLFQAWEPVRNRASGNAEKWFRQHLRDIGLRDDTPKRKLLGMHAFRHTILTHGVRQKPSLNLTVITGHSQKIEGIVGVAKGYLDMALINSLAETKALLDQLDYQITFHRPA